METVLEFYNKAGGGSFAAGASLDRLFGVFPVEVKRAIVL
jgi:hypothetical protein